MLMAQLWFATKQKITPLFVTPRVFSVYIYAYIKMISVFLSCFFPIEMAGSTLNGTRETKYSLYDHRPIPFCEDDYLRVSKIPKRKVGKIRTLLIEWIYTSIISKFFIFWLLLICNYFQGANFRDLPGVIVGGDNVARRDPKEQILLPSGKPLVIVCLFYKKRSILLQCHMLYGIELVSFPARYPITPSHLKKANLKG